MTHSLRDWIRRGDNLIRMLHGTSPNARTIELGCRCAEGQEDLSLRPIFERHGTYIGIDLQDGPDVDLVRDIAREKMTYIEYADLIICCETLEHIPEFWRVIRNIRRYAHPGACVLISVPDIGFPYHEHPVDCYRFTEYALRSLMPGRDVTYERLSDGHGNWTHVAFSFM